MALKEYIGFTELTRRHFKKGTHNGHWILKISRRLAMLGRVNRQPCVYRKAKFKKSNS